RVGWRGLHPGGEEGRAPAAVVVLRQLQVVALAVHPDGDVPDPGPGVEPGPQRPERAVVGGQRVAGEADSRTQELAALVAHGLLDHVIGSPKYSRGDRSPPRARGRAVELELTY